MNQERGFTLLELAITIFIIILLSSALFLTTKEQDAKAALNKTANLLAQNLRGIQEKSMAAQSFSCGAVSTRIFGINLKKTGGVWEKNYTFFAECTVPPDFIFNSPPDMPVTVFDLEKGVRVCSVEMVSGVGPPPPVPVALNFSNIVFEPPHPFVHLNGVVLPPPSEITTTFCAEINPALQKKVKVNTSGKVEIE